VLLPDATNFRSYTTAKVTGNTQVGGFIGGSGASASEAVFWVSDDNSGLSDSGFAGDVTEIHSESAANLKKKSTFTAKDWDFDEVWIMPEGGGYPILRWQ